MWFFPLALHKEKPWGNSVCELCVTWGLHFFFHVREKYPEVRYVKGDIGVSMLTRLFYFSSFMGLAPANCWCVCSFFLLRFTFRLRLQGLELSKVHDISFSFTSTNVNGAPMWVLGGAYAHSHARCASIIWTQNFVSRKILIFVSCGNRLFCITIHKIEFVSYYHFASSSSCGFLDSVMHFPLLPLFFLLDVRTKELVKNNWRL